MRQNYRDKHAVCMNGYKNRKQIHKVYILRKDVPITGYNEQMQKVKMFNSLKLKTSC